MSDTRARLLLLRDFFLEQTDEKHAVSARELIAFLELRGIPANRRAVYEDIALLRQYGVDIRVRRRRANEYYMGARIFERQELRLLADMTRANRDLTRERADSIIQKLASLLSRFESAQIRPPRGENPWTADGERAYQNAGTILAALERGVKVSFVYRQFTANETPYPRWGGTEYIVNPCLLAYAEDRYYLIADHPAHGGLAHYRLDEMEDVRALDEPSAPMDPAFDSAEYRRSVFSMAPAELRWVRLAFERQYIGAMTDRFGTNLPMVQLDDQTCEIAVPVRVSPPFYGWVFQFGGGVRIVAPEDVRERMLLMLEAARRSGGNR